MIRISSSRNNLNDLATVLSSVPAVDRDVDIALDQRLERSLRGIGHHFDIDVGGVFPENPSEIEAASDSRYRRRNRCARHAEVRPRHW